MSSSNVSPLMLMQLYFTYTKLYGDNARRSYGMGRLGDFVPLQMLFEQCFVVSESYIWRSMVLQLLPFL